MATAPIENTAEEPPRRGPGRPRKQGAEESILRATIDLMTAGGVKAATVDAVAKRAGVARATVYLRWRTHDELIAGALRQAIGRQPYPLTRDIAADLRSGSEQARRILETPAFKRLLPEIVRGLLEPVPLLTYDMIGPNRRLVAEEYRELAAQSGLRTDVDAELVADLLIGGMLNRLLATGKPPSEADAVEVAEIVLAGLRLPAA